MSAIKIIQAFAKKSLTKNRGSGIMELPSDMVVEAKAGEIAAILQRAGIELNQLDNFIRSEKDLLKYLNIIEATSKPNYSVYSGQEAANQLNKFFGKKGEVVDLTGKKLDPGQPIIGGTQDDTVTGIMTKVDDRMKGINEASKKLQELMDERDVMFGKAPKTKKNPKVQEREMFREANERLNQGDTFIADTVTKITSMEPVEAMKEANKIIGRKGIYKNLTKEQSQKILKDTDDWIFQRDLADRWDYTNNRPFRDDPNFDPDDPDYLQRMKDEDAPDFAKGGRAGYNDGMLVEPVEIDFASAEDKAFDDMMKAFRYYINSGGTKSLRDYMRMSVGRKRIGGGKEHFRGASGGRAGYYTGGITDVKPNLSDIGHGSDALMARTRLMSPGAQATTSTGLNYLLAEDNDNIRVPFSAGGFNAARRAFLKMMGIGAAGVGAAKTGLFGLLKGSKPAAVKELTQVPIKNVEGMPYWFKPLVNKVIKEGEQMKVTEYDRLITHKSQLPNSKTDVYVNQDLNTGDVWVDIGLQKHGFPDGKFGQPVRLEYKASEAIEPDVSKTGKVKSKGGETKDEFWVEEAEFTGGQPENVKFEDVSYEKFGNHGSDFSEVEAFAMGKKKKTRDISSLQKQEEDLADHFSNYPEPDDFASGGRAGFAGGNLAKLLAGKSITGSSRRFLEKVFGKERFETMIANDPDMHRGMLEVVEMFRKKDKEGLKMYMQKFLPHMDDATVEDFIIGGEGTEGIQGQLIRLGSGRDYRDKIQMIKQADNIRKLDALDVDKMKPNAEGGRIGKWMGGPLGVGKSQLRELLKFMAKGSSHGKTPSEMLYMLNPKQFNKILNDPLLAGKFSAEAPQGIAGLIKDYTKKMHSDRADMLGELIGTGRKIKKADDKLITYKMTIIDDMVSKGVDRRTAEEMAEVMSKMVSDQSGFTQKATPKITEQGLLELENIQKNILTKDRKLQATGGLTTMLGE